MIWINSLTKYSTTQLSKHTIDSFLLNTKAEQFTDKGLLLKKINTTYLEHFPKENMSLFKKPRVTLFSNDAKPWHLSSVQGKSYNNNQIIELEGDAVAHQDGSLNKSATTVKSKRFFYNTKTAIISTPDPSVIIRNQIITHAKGLKFNTNTSTLILDSDMVIHYTPKKTT